MGLIKTTGIVIKEINYNDNDKIINILTPDLGQIACIAKGARKIKSPLLASTQYLVYSNFLLYKGTSMYHINSSEVINTFYNLRIDYDKLNKVFVLTKLLKELIQENQDSENILRLFLNTLYLINKEEKTEREIDKIINIFKIKLVVFLGYMPKLNRCSVCDKQIANGETSYIFSFNQNGIICSSKCKKEVNEYIKDIKLTNGAYNAIKYIMYSDLKKIFVFESSEEVEKQLEEFAEIYIKTIIEY